jgi:hypothetical protein
MRVRVTPSQKKAFDAEAKRLNYSNTSEWARKLLLDAIKKEDPPQLPPPSDVFPKLRNKS